MSSNETTLGNAHVKALADQALLRSEGITVKTDHSSAIRLRQQFYVMRRTHRKENKKIYSSDHPMHSQSPYDSLQVTIKKEHDGAWYVCLRTGLASLAGFEIIDNETGLEIKPEEL